MTVRQLARLLGVNETTVYAWIKRQPVYFPMPRRTKTGWVFNRLTVQRWIFRLKYPVPYKHLKARVPL